MTSMKSKMLDNHGLKRCPEPLGMYFLHLLLCVCVTVSSLAVVTSVHAAQLCAIPGKDGPGAPSGVINTYYPGNASVSAGATSIPVGAPSGNTAALIAAGDLLLIIQMQDADFNYTNDSNYGSNSATGFGYTAINQAGLYEYATAAGSVSGGFVPITTPLANSYRRRTASATNGQSTFQVIRVPQYSTATVSGTLSALFWNGSVGGVVAIDVAGALTVNGTISADGAGFRGGWGEVSATAPAAGLATYFTRTTSQGNGMKGEGIAGTPNRMNQPTTFNGPPNQVTSGSLGYPGGGNSDAAKGYGAPGNAGGGGTDGTTNNDENSGGGGGGNYATGAKGGNSWNSNLAVGGNGGGAVNELAFNRVVMGGGGGAATSNNGTSDNTTYPSPTPPGLACSSANAACSSGAPGGGIVLLRANTMGGSGTITANGGSAYNVGNDGAGGGGAAGSIVLYTQAGGSATVNANGGDGGNAWRSHTTLIDRHGPGGGGSGGFIAYSPASGFALTPTYNPGVSGRSCLDDFYGTLTSSGGLSTFQAPSVPGPQPGAACLPRLTVSKSTSTATIPTLPGTASYSISVANAAGTSTAKNVTITDYLPGAPALFTNSTVAPAIAYTPNSAPCNTSRTAVSNAATGTSSPSWSSWDIPTGCTVTLPFSVTVPAGTIPAVYQNPATVTYDDPVYVGQRTSASYNPATSTAEDVNVLASPSISKAFGAGSIIAGGNTTLTITLTNPNSTAITGVTFSDTLPTTASGAPGNMTILNPPVPTSTCGGTPTVTAVNGSGTFTVGGSGYTIPAAGSCTVTFTVTAPTAGIYVNTIPAGSLASSTGSNTSPATASLTVGTGLLPPTMTKSFAAPKTILTGGTSILTFTLTNPNATAIGSAGFIDTLPAELVITTPAASNTCGGTLTAVTGTGYISLNTDGTIPASGSCTVTVNVTSTTPGIYNNTSGQVVGDTGTGNRASDTLVVMAPLVIAKSFATNPVAIATATVLTITLTNPNPVAVTGAAFTDTYPAGLVNTASASPATTCGGAPTITAANGGSSLAVGGSGASVPANSSCTVTVNVQAAGSGSYTNSTGAVTTSDAGSSAAATAVLNVLAPPIVLKSFTPSQINSGGQSNLQLVIGNPSTNTAALTGVVLADNYSGTMTNAAAYTSMVCTDGSSATISGGVNGGTSVGITAGTIQPGGTCTINQLVTATSSNSNTTTAPTSTNGGTGTAATAYLQVTQALLVSKTFSVTRTTRTTVFVMTISLTNPNSVAVTNVAFTDTYPTAPSTITNSGAANATWASGACTGTLTAANNGPSLALTNGTVPAGGACTITVNVMFPATATNNRVVTNSTGNVTAANAPTAPGDSATVAVGTGVPTVSFTKTFLTNPINVGGTTSLRFIVTNPTNGANPASAITFTDVLPAGLTVADSTQNNVCGAGSTLTATAATNTITLTGGTRTPNTTCTMTVANVSATVPGIYINRAGPISASSGSGGYAEDDLTVRYPPSVSKSFGSNSFTTAGSTTMTLSFTNPNSTAITVSPAFDDVFPVAPGAMTLFDGTLVNNTCGFTPTNTLGTALAAGNVGVRVPNTSSIPAGGCYFTVNVKANTAGNYTNTTAALVTSAGTASAASASVTVVAQPPSLSKTFVPSTVATGVSTRLVITLANPNAAPISLSALLTDTFPTNVTTAATPNRATTCYAASGALAATGGTASTVTLASGAIIPAGTPENPGTCTLAVDVTASASGVYTNTIPAGALQTTSGNNAAAASAVLTVFQNTPPTVSKAFGTTAIGTGQSTTLTLTLSNTNPAAATLSSNLDDTFPANLVIATPSGLTGTCTLGSVTLTTIGINHVIYNSGATIPAGGCTIIVNVTSNTAASYTNTIATGALVTNLGSSPGATSDSLTFYAPPTIAKAFGATNIAVGGTTALNLTVTNPNSGIAISGIAFTDTLPAGLTAVNGTTATCGGSLVITGTNLLTFTGGSLAASANCVITTTVTGAAAGAQNNTTSAVTASGPIALTGVASNTATVTVSAAPSIAKSFSPASVDASQTSTMTFTLNNSNGNTLTTANFTDTLTGFSVAAPATIGGTCSGVSSSPALVAGATSLNLTVPSLAAGSCTITIPVSAISAGTYTNTTSGVTTVETGATAGSPSNTATLTVIMLPLQVTKTPNVFTATPGSTINYVIGYGNPNVYTWFQSVVITDPVPPYTTFQSAVCGALPANITSCTITAPPVGGTGTVTWTLGGNLNAGSSGTVTLSVKID